MNINVLYKEGKPVGFINARLKTLPPKLSMFCQQLSKSYGCNFSYGGLSAFKSFYKRNCSKSLRKFVEEKDI